MVTEYIIKREYFYPSDIKSLLAYVNLIKKKIPKGISKDDVKISIRLMSDYGDDFIGMDVYYEREETEEEQLEIENNRREYDLKLLERLEKKYRKE